VYKKVADSGGVVIQTRGFSIVGTHEPLAAGCCTMKDIRRLWLGCLLVQKRFFAFSKPLERQSIGVDIPWWLGDGVLAKAVLERGDLMRDTPFS
jgi:hypothetical protein